jgi:hypothetical protein
MAKGDTTFGTPVFAKPEWGGLKKVYGKVTLVGNYETGGYDFLLDTAFNLGEVLFVGLPPTVIGYIPEYKPITDKLMFYKVGAGTTQNIVERKIVESVKASVAISQADVEVFQYTVPETASLVGVRAYCTALAGTPSVDVKNQAASVLTGVISLVAGADTAGVLTGGAAALTATNVVTVHVTTDGDDTVTDLTVVLEIETTRAATAPLSGPLVELADDNAALTSKIISFEVIHRGV